MVTPSAHQLLISGKWDGAYKLWTAHPRRSAPDAATSNLVVIRPFSRSAGLPCLRSLNGNYGSEPEVRTIRYRSFGTEAVSPPVDLLLLEVGSRAGLCISTDFNSL